MSFRPITRDDFGPVVELLSADEERMYGRPSRIGVGDLEQWLSRSDLPVDSWLLEDEAGLLAAGWSDAVGDLAVGIGVVHPRAKGRGLGRQLADRSEARARERGVRRIHQFVLGGDPAATRLFLDRGYREVRRFYEMAIDLDSDPPLPSVPAGLELETLREEDARSFFDALDEAFQDHWEHHSQPFEQWWERHRKTSGFDLSLWFLIRDGGEIAAAARNEANRNGGGYVGALGVRRPWRGRGLGRALLLHAFREFHARGIARVTLGVDATSPTGATKLYESVGMTVEQENVVYERTLR
ncbi:MAG TPA: GNAT family N-acetyltransferase [Gaiellaceae bacterium]|nr:GNAT family N-acetyltransferase [Gaiellaceae bacterium]